MSMVPEIVIQLLKKIHFYYPVGMPHIFKEYEGYQILCGKIGKKIEEIIENQNTSWSNLVMEIKEKIPNQNVWDQAYLQFPNYLIQIDIKKFANNEIEYTNSIVLNISLLVDFYTVFFQDLVRVKNKIGYSRYYRIVYLDSCLERKSFETIDLINEIIMNYFPVSKFISHKILFRYKIFGGNIYGTMENDLTNPYSFYQYLFNNDDKHPDEVLE